MLKKQINVDSVLKITLTQVNNLCAVHLIKSSLNINIPALVPIMDQGRAANQINLISFQLIDFLSVHSRACH